MTDNIINGKRRVALNGFERAMLRDALHVEGVNSGDYDMVIRIRTKLGLGPLAGERAVAMPS